MLTGRGAYGREGEGTKGSGKLAGNSKCHKQRNRENPMPKPKAEMK